MTLKTENTWWNKNKPKFCKGDR